MFKPGAVAKANVHAEAGKAASNGGGHVKHTFQNSIRGFSASMSASGAQQAALHNKNIAYCEQDQEVEAIQSDPLAFRTLGKPAPPTPAQTKPWGITRVNGGSGSSSGTAWVIDTGIDLDHPDLNVDVGRSRSFVRDSSPDDFNGHGSHVSGIIAAKDNSIGVIGVTPGATLVSVRVLDRSGSGSNSGVIAGVDYVAGAGHAGDVANMSLGGGVSQALDDAVVAAAATGVKFTLAAGNESQSATLHSPARANGPNVYTVSSFAQGDNWSSFSNFGNPPIDYAEPGSSIFSSYKNGGYATLSGTSMAAPHLAGILLGGAVHSGGTVHGDPSAPADTIGVK
ncbi:MAG TPA: S8 family serine peptidase [Sphingomicrobium sp.]|nr:S8 family serine peptidase [Sphingomicrobium sp.]